jgi:D-3-phosphoglycerate dehydrogenase
MANVERVLVSDPVAAECLEVFRGAADVEVDYRPGLKPPELFEVIPAYSGLIVRSETKVTKEVLERASRLRAVVRAGVGVDNIDVAEATRRGVLVMNCPGANTVAAAEHTIALMLALARNVPQAHASVRAGRWERAKFVGAEIAGKTLGVIGLGKIGREVARRAVGLGMVVLGYDPFITAEAATAAKIETAPLDEVIARADFLTVHVPLTGETRGLIGRATIAKMKRGVRILNVARGGIVDEAALAEAAASGRIAGAALDVFEKEPVDPENPLLKLDSVIVTPHLGASTKEAQEAVGKESARQILDYLRHGAISNAVNMVAVEPALARKVGPWQTLCDRLGSLAAQLRDGEVQRVTISYAGEFFGENERKLLTLALLKGFLQHYVDAPINYVNAAHFAREHGVDVVEQTSLSSEGYLNLVSLGVETTAGTRRVAGTIFGEKHPRLVAIDGYDCDALPEGHVFLVSNNDTPGIIGKIGTILGERHVNIATMSVGRDRTGGRALAIMTIDSPVPEDAVRQLEAEPGILWTRTVRLGSGS